MFMLILAKKQIKKKFEFFDQNRGLALLENWDFWPYERFPVLWSKKVSVLFRRPRDSLVSLF